MSPASQNRYHFPGTKWTVRRHGDEVVFEEWTEINGTHVGILRTLTISAADWVDAVVHVSSFGGESARERAEARSMLQNLHRGS